jgi:hypothetical protein
MSEKQPDVESALASFGAPPIPYRNFSNGIVPLPSEAVAVPNYAADAVFPRLAAALPDVSGLAACPAATGAAPKATNGPTACAVPIGPVAATAPGPGTPMDGFLSSCVGTVASASADDRLAWTTGQRRSSEAGARRVAAYGQVSIAGLFAVLGAPPAAQQPPSASAAAPGDLRQVFRMLERTD